MKTSRELFAEIKRLADMVTEYTIIKPVVFNSTKHDCTISAVYIPERDTTRIDIKHIHPEKEPGIASSK